MRASAGQGQSALPQDTIGDVIDWTYSGNKLHRHRKPLSVLLPLVETFLARRAAWCLTRSRVPARRLIAARALGRAAIGIELDTKYHAIASQRLAVERHHSGNSCVSFLDCTRPGHLKTETRKCHDSYNSKILPQPTLMTRPPVRRINAPPSEIGIGCARREFSRRFVIGELVKDPEKKWRSSVSPPSPWR